MLTKYEQEILGDTTEAQRLSDKIVPVDVTAATNWFYKAKSKVDWRLADDFPCMAPPWPDTWMEYSFPREVNELGEMKTVDHPPSTRWGMYFKAVDLHDADQDLEEIVWSINLNSELFLQEYEDSRWFCYQEISYSTRNRHHHYGAVSLLLDEVGQIVTDFRGKPVAEVAATEWLLGYLNEKKARVNIQRASQPFYFATSLLHCNNVDTYNDEVPDAVRKKRRKTGKNPGKTFKCLDVDPMKNQSKRESGEGESDAERALHICRGHFKTYTEDNPLFGQHTGTYWWPMHVRGSKEQGEVEKSYRVNEPDP